MSGLSPSLAEGEPPTILVVEDDEDLRCTLAEMIPVLGLGRCLGAASLAEVEAHRAAALACAVAILDINLGADAPSGIDVYEWLRCFHFAGKVVFLTGHGANDPSVRKASSIAATRTLAKPIGVQELVALVAQGRHAR